MVIGVGGQIPINGKIRYMASTDIVRNFFRTHIRTIAHWLNSVSGGKLKPNTVTTVGVAMHLPIAILIAEHELLWAAVLLVFFGLFDTLDGELARIQHTASNRGMLYDAATDRIKEILLYSGIAYALTTSHQARWAFVAATACGASITVSFIKAKGEAALALQQNVTDHHALNYHFKAGLAPFEVRMTILVLGLLSNQLLAATVLIAVLASVNIWSRLRMINEQL